MEQEKLMLNSIRKSLLALKSLNNDYYNHKISVRDFNNLNKEILDQVKDLLINLELKCISKDAINMFSRVFFKQRYIGIIVHKDS